VAAGLNRQADKQAVLQRKVDFSELQPLLISPAVAHHPWAVKSTVSPELATRIQQALLALQHTGNGQKILISAGLTGFSPASDEDYDPHRRIIYRVTGEDYGAH
jgi:ABC-type phosphate/phosphonate transport system substrate-binding protein